MGFFDSKLSPADKAVQKKVRDGERTTDTRAVQARLRALQSRHLDGQVGGIPSGAESIVAAPNVDPAITAMNATSEGMANRGQPDWGGKSGELERAIRQINGSNTTAAFSLSMSTTGLTLPMEWTCSGSFSLGPLSYVSGNSGSGGGTANTGGGTAGGNTSSSGYGAGGNASASGNYSGANLSGGASGGVSGGGSASTGASAGSAGTQGSSGQVERETYRANIVCSFRITWEVVMGWNPLSWGANIADEIDGVKRGSGSASGCGWFQFTVAGA